VLTLALSDGSSCLACGAEAGGSGRLESCGPGCGHAVRAVETPNILRQVFTGLSSALGADGTVAPMAEVVITDATGQDHVFVSPPPVDMSDD
jgi:hypothetical protein